MGVDYHLNAFTKPSSYSTEMNYPSTTQALFALVVMIIVLLFIMVYCCSGTFPCNQTDENGITNPDPTGRRIIQNRITSGRSHGTGAADESDDLDSSRRTVVIVPINGMIYCREQLSDRSAQITQRDKPPAYSDLFSPPPPYSIRTVTPSPTSDLCILPPAYEDSFQDWKLTLNNDNRFDSLLSESPRVEPLSQTINELISEATQSISTRSETSPRDRAINILRRSISTISSRTPSIRSLRSSPARVVSRLEGHSPSHSETSSQQIGSTQQIRPSSRGDDFHNTSANNLSAGDVERGVESEQFMRTNSELVLRVPESDVYCLIRDVTLAEHSRRDIESGVKE